ncbi:hypothetical protein NKI88_29520 [Mesorhizobium sp. M0317]|uniref:Uncharacterized protein n=1 Tax=Mesorhizobium australicum TaxID=536018 RepID=A0ACC6T0N4_9HYPH|nr:MULTISPECIES: hypothetical protein [unclassified Mesorhizobium]ESZ24328.1 hypothetical protein X733_32120 [Mesorhizobium sp. L2C067A000]ESZ34494.1 hypothetical protein X731_31045 [Mesorhizobium sp. L2C054A000]
MKMPVKADLANDNGKPEDHQAAATTALHKAVAGLDASAELLAAILAAPNPAKPTISN